MVRIGLLSDTHGHIDKNMLKFLKNVDEIWHAGDIGTLEILEKLESEKKVRAVFGNIDNNKLRQELNKIEIFKIEDVKVLMTHIGGYPKRYERSIKEVLVKEKPKIFVCGHSHILKVIYDQELDLLHLNPGAAGKQGFHGVRTMIRFSIDNSQIKDLEVWEYKR